MVVSQIAVVKFPTRWAEFRLRAYEGRWTGTEIGGGTETALALVLGDVRHGSPLVRIHSQCTTGEVFHSLRCDCHDQLHLALERIAEEGRGALIYEQKEGRGIGLLEKLRAYELQDRGLDTIEANLELGHPVDARDYLLPAAILGMLGIRCLRLMTNNPEKLAAVRSAGIEVTERVSADVPSTRHSAGYMATKRQKLGHFSREESTAAREVLGRTGLAVSSARHGMTLD
ncbi:MAG TPA: GTP cyclohydrolase II [Terracidiphilus sp.]|jgi:GTP cyclohydrolase II|nr:GTP cyclohydrolase II [Terracidiphilus sp.]